MKARRSRSISGLTLLEVMIGMMILTVGVISFMGAFTNITASIHYSRTTSLASNLAQEKIEYLKNIPYYRLLVTTSAVTATEAGLGGFSYDSGYYPPEHVTVGQINFERRVLIQKVTESGGNLATNNWYDQETGLKLVTSYVLWNENGEWKKFVVTNLRDDPNRKKMTSSFLVNVKSGGTNLANVTVRTLEDPLLKGLTDASGNTTIKVASGTYTLRANPRGYFPMDIVATVADSSTQTVNFNLTPMGSGTVGGIAYLDTHIVVSAVCASASNVDDTIEYVELYNPSSLSGIAVPNYAINYVRTSDGAETAINPAATTRYVHTVIPPHGYFLIASSPVINGVTADAYYSDTGLINSVPDNRIPVAESGGIALVAAPGDGYDTVGSTVDAIGWGRTGSGPWGPSNASEGSGFRFSGTDGLPFQNTLERMAFSTATAITMSLPSGIHAFVGSAWDSNDNFYDWVWHNDAANDFPRNSLVIQAPQSGTPAVGASVFIDDGLSGSAVVQGGASPGTFSVTSVATGTWSILISSNGWAYSNDSGVVLPTSGSSINLGNILISSRATGGFVSGRVVDSSNIPIAGIAVETPGATDVTDAAGTFRLFLDTGTYDLIANGPNPATHNSSYTEGDSTSVVVNLGADTVVPDIVIFSGGILKGMVTSNGTDALPGIPVIATSSVTGLEVANVISDSLGRYTFPDLPVGSYTITPQLESGESASPSQFVKTVVAGSTVFIGTFTVSNAFGTMSGTVQASTAAITTGVLLAAVAQPNTIAVPPTIDSTLRTGGTKYYMASSDARGNYSIRAPGGVTYNVYAWYTTMSGNNTTTTVRSSAVTLPAGGTATATFSW